MKTLASADEVSILLRRKPATIHRWARDGSLPSLAVGNDYVFDLEAVARWAEKKGALPQRKARR